MKKIILAIALLGAILPLPAAIEPFAQGQLFISVHAGFVPHSDTEWDVMYSLSFESAISRNVSVGFTYLQKQPSARDTRDSIVIPLPPSPLSLGQGMMYEDISSRMFCLEGKYHFALAGVRRLDLFCGSGLGVEMNKNKYLSFIFTPAGTGQNKDEQGTLEIVRGDSNRYYLVANFFGGADYYLVDNLALSAKAGYQYSGISGYDLVLNAGITFRIR